MGEGERGERKEKRRGAEEEEGKEREREKRRERECEIGSLTGSRGQSARPFEVFYDSSLPR